MTTIKIIYNSSEILFNNEKTNEKTKDKYSIIYSDNENLINMDAFLNGSIEIGSKKYLVSRDGINLVMPIMLDNTFNNYYALKTGYKTSNKFYEIGEINLNQLYPISINYRYYMLCEFPDNNIKIKYIVKIGTQLNYLMDENIYEFNPKLDGKSLFTYIEGLSAKGYIGDTKENITKQMEKDYPRTQEFSFYFLKSFPKEGTTYKFEEDNIKDFFWDEMKKTFYNNSSNLSFLQSWSKNVIICLLLAKDNLNLARYIFMQTYPYIAFFEEFIYRNVKDGSPYFNIFEFQKINKNKKLGLNIFINISYPFSLKIFKNNLINRYLLDNYVQDWESKNEVNLGKILKNSKMESKRNMVKNKLRLLYFYSDYSQEEVKKYYAKYGLIFMHFSLFLPDLIYLNNNPQIYKIMNSSAEDPETFSNMKDGISVMNYFMSKSDSEIIRLREENVKLIGSYYNYIKSIISENPYYDQKTFDSVTKVILQSRGKTVNNKLIKNTYTDIPNINRMFEEIITSGITY